MKLCVILAIVVPPDTFDPVTLSPAAGTGLSALNAALVIRISLRTVFVALTYLVLVLVVAVTLLPAPAKLFTVGLLLNTIRVYAPPLYPLVMLTIVVAALKLPPVKLSPGCIVVVNASY